MRKIYKYVLEITSEQAIEMPSIRKYLKVGEDYDGKLVIWAAVDTSSNVENVSFEIYGTGQELINQTIKTISQSYLGTQVMKNGLAWHVFERKYK